MSELEEQLRSVLNDPDMMAKVQQLAQSMGGSPPPQSGEPKQEPQQPSAFPVSPDMLQMAMQLAGQSGMDKRQQALLGAMKPYLSTEKSERLRRAMEAAHLAQLATQLMGGGFQGGDGHV